MTYETSLNRKIKTTLTAIEFNNTLNKRHEMSGFVSRRLEEVMKLVPGCNTDRAKRLELEKKIKFYSNLTNRKI